MFLKVSVLILHVWFIFWAIGHIVFISKTKRFVILFSLIKFLKKHDNYKIWQQ